MKAGFGALEEDPRRGLGRAATLSKLDRHVEVDLDRGRELEREELREARAQELFDPPVEHSGVLVEENRELKLSRHAPFRRRGEGRGRPPIGGFGSRQERGCALSYTRRSRRPSTWL